MKTNIYIDGFNLYYGCIKDTSYHWLDVSKMCSLLLPNDRIHRIKYFTALVSARPNDPEQPVRQQLFLRALQTIPNLEIILGTFLSHEVKMPLSPIGSGYAKVIKTEEKGSDVNIATHLLMDGFRNDYELAVVVSNDSDLLLPIQVVTQQFKNLLACSTRKNTRAWRYYRMCNSSRKFAGRFSKTVCSQMC
jgi:uncharacterized LabA/DUF88 family protein